VLWLSLPLSSLALRPAHFLSFFLFLCLLSPPPLCFSILLFFLSLCPSLFLFLSLSLPLSLSLSFSLSLSLSLSLSFPASPPIILTHSHTHTHTHTHTLTTSQKVPI